MKWINCLSVGLGFLSLAVLGAESQFVSPSDVDYRTEDVWSEGVRLSAEIFSPVVDSARKYPTIVMCHGWGGEAHHLRRDAVLFAQNGFLVVTFDYRGWGASDGRLIATGRLPQERDSDELTLPVRELRGLVDPIEQTTDLLNVIHWVQGEPLCDPSRIGLWGSSFSGGHVIYAAARDLRVKATVSQVPSMDGRWAIGTAQRRQASYAEATGRAHGRRSYPRPGAQVIGNLKGAPVIEKMMRYAPVEDAARTGHCAKLIVIAENEELFDNREHGIRLFEKAPGVKKLVTVPKIKHYGIYYEARKQAQQLALDWFRLHLK